MKRGKVVKGGAVGEVVKDGKGEEEVGVKGVRKVRQSLDWAGKIWEGADLDGMLKGTKGAASVMWLVRGKLSRRELAARLGLARMQGRVLARRYAPKAVKVLGELLTSQERWELRMKGALALLGISGIGGEKRKERGVMKKEEEEKVRPEDRAEVMEMRSAVAELLGRWREDEAMGEFEGEKEK